MVHSLNIDVSRYATHWGLRLASDIIGTSQAYIIFGYRQTIPVALKIRRSAMQNADDKDYSTLALQSFAGNGAVRCIDQFADAVLLEQVMPGTPLSHLVAQDADDKATRIFCQVMHKLHTVTAEVTDFPTAAQGGASFHSYLVRPTSSLLSLDLVKKAAQLYDKLSVSQKNCRLLHGDLHHDNILFDDIRGWIAIDPKGIVGEAEYEIGTALRNPGLDTRLYAHTPLIERRIDIITQQLGLDKKRIVSWCFAQAVLSSVWAVEDGESEAAIHRGVAVARATLPLLEGASL